MSNEIRIGIIGNVNAGKSTTIGVIINGILDNGRGSARSSILNHQHEKNTGRTSSITQKYLKNLELKKDFVFIDLAGHEAYLRTTLHGLAGYYIDYVIVIIGANMGVSRMTKEHLILALSLQIPFFIVITKIDICPENILISNINHIKKIMKSNYVKRKIELINSDAEYQELLKKKY